MARQKGNRNYRVVTIKFFCDTDADLIAWFDSLQAGERSDAVRHAIRGQMGGVLPAIGQRVSVQDLIEVQRETTRIRQTLDQMPNLIEQVFQRHLQTVMVSSSVTVAAPPARAGISDDAAARKAQRLAHADW
ncbi:MAG: hypothetical protein ACOYL5_09650 [Phototrophicaceae bacterium]